MSSLQRNAIKKRKISALACLVILSSLSRAFVYTSLHVFCEMPCSGAHLLDVQDCFALCGTSGIDWPVTLSFPCLCTVRGFFPWAWTSSELRVRASLLCLLAPCTGAGPGCFEEWPFHQGWPTKLAGMGSGSWFLTQSCLLLLVNCCSTLSLNTVVCMIYADHQKLPGHVKLGSLLCHIRKDVKVEVGFVLCPGWTGSQPARVGGIYWSRQRFSFLQCCSELLAGNGLAEMLVERLQRAQPLYVCLLIDKNCSGDLMAFEKGMVGDKALSGDNDKRTEAENERAVGW